uniref:OrNV_gp098-like protein n=1 Tax=Nilaparvata lugens endogenous nudivirus TaxID=1487700 RepID=X5GF06_9VIRU|nr:OrNV_gp098-like protein [Nilaparvata lugens endogenous nudivirus]
MICGKRKIDEPDAMFLTSKISIQPLSEYLTVYDFQLRDHLRTTRNIYLKNTKCTCSHSHNKIACPFTETSYCQKCSTSNRLCLDYKSLLFHQNLENFKLSTCCVHVHTPPCGVCINCRTQPLNYSQSTALPRCIVQEPFECVHTTDL